MANIYKYYCNKLIDFEIIFKKFNEYVFGKEVLREKFNDVYVISFEKYFFRNGSYTALNIIINYENNSTYVTLIGFGGGDGLFNYSRGSNKSITYKPILALEELNFKKIAESY